jgi:very-short-patch-repair endonuclease
MPAKNIVTGQKVSPEKVQRAKELRQQMTEAEELLWQHLRTNRTGGYSCFSDELPLHMVCLDAYSTDKTEVPAFSPYLGV